MARANKLTSRTCAIFNDSPLSELTLGSQVDTLTVEDLFSMLPICALLGFI